MVCEVIRCAMGLNHSLEWLRVIPFYPDMQKQFVRRVWKWKVPKLHLLSSHCGLATVPFPPKFHSPPPISVESKIEILIKQQIL